MSEKLPLSSHAEPATTADNPDVELFDWVAFRQNGLLWAINRYVLHPRGLAMAPFVAEGEEAPVGWQMHRSDDGLYAFDDETDHSGKERFDAFLGYIAERTQSGSTQPQQRKETRHVPR